VWRRSSDALALLFFSEYTSASLERRVQYYASLFFAEKKKKKTQCKHRNALAMSTVRRSFPAIGARMAAE
jgi:hypothetical protein